MVELELAKKGHRGMFLDQEHGYMEAWTGAGIPGEEEVVRLRRQGCELS